MKLQHVVMLALYCVCTPACVGATDCGDASAESQGSAASVFLCNAAFCFNVQVAIHFIVQRHLF